MTLNIGLIGAGRIGVVHAATITQRIPSARLVAVADVNEAAARACAERYNVPFFTADPQAVIARPDVHAVLICSSTDTHAPLIEAAAQAGKPIFCEKPIALDLAAIDRALNAVARAGVPLQIGFNRRFDPNFERLRRAVAEGEIGEPHLLHIVSRDPAPPPIEYIKVSGGLFLDMAIHDFDMARFLLGSEIEEVHAIGAVRVDPAIGAAGDIDTAVTLLRFANGAIGTIDNSRRAVYGYDQRAEVFGSKGMAQALNNFPNQVILSTADAVRRDLPLHFFMQRYIESYQREIEAFVQAVTQGTPPPVSGEDGRIAVVIGLAAQRSLREGRPVRVQEIGA
ncbi:MAG: inositol 2-dehydrogenase [Thermoflexales bacterium]|nr:inositol 2-dehydrogenase [Thermoflexales bacterium]MDW8293071.1 inositol 2-dehydrogenase [Anaerolineae bacterium]